MPRFAKQRAAEDPNGFALVDVTADGAQRTPLRHVLA